MASADGPSQASASTHHVVGAVVASPQSKEVYATIPSMGAYTTIDIDSFLVIGSDTDFIDLRQEAAGANERAAADEKEADRRPREEISPSKGDNKTMNDITREEFDAKLSAVEARMDARFVSIEGKIEGFLSAQVERDKRFEQQFHQIDRQFNQIDQRFQHMDESLEGIRKSVSAQKYWLAGIGVAVVLGIMGANATIFSGAKSFFDGGVERSEVKALLEEVRAQTVETRALIESREESAAITPDPSSTPQPSAE